VNDITLLASWVTSAQVYINKNTDLFPVKLTNSLNGCPTKALVRKDRWSFSTNYVENKVSYGSIVRYREGLEYDSLLIICEHINMSFVHVPSPEGLEIEGDSLNKISGSMFKKETYII